ncbi:MAG: hypothetical protein KFH87_10005 [Bacteroidetes bacterium]|nr:hypothetical protein [Bacteroidota bacterium]
MFIAFVVVFILLAVGAYFYVQHQSFHGMVWEEVRDMVGEHPVALDVVRERDSLPAPMRRYLDWALPGDRAPATFARLRHGGTFRRSADEDWFSIRGEQYYATAEPAFIWAATMKMNPLLWVRGRDKYVDGRGHMLIRLLSAITVVDAAGPEMDRSTLLRYMSEMPWFPTAFLTVPGIEFSAPDDSTVELRMTHAGHTVSGRFTIAADGAVTRFYTEDRYREMEGEMVRMPWYGEYADPKLFDGMRIPTAAEVAWQTPEGPLPYVRIAIERMEYDVPLPF